MSANPKYEKGNCHLVIPCHFATKSRCSLKSHSSTCLSTPLGNSVFEDGDDVYKDEDEFPQLLTPSPGVDTDESPKRKKRKKRKKKVFTVDMKPSSKVVIIGAKHHKCRLHRNRRDSGRQRLHSDSSCQTKRDSEFAGVQLNGGSLQSKRARLAIGVVALALILLSVFLVGITLRMAPVIDELVRKENEEIYRAMAAGPTTTAPVTDSSTVGTNNVTSSGPPG